MKYKMEDGKIAVGENGHPVVIQDSGEEIELRATELFQTKIPALNAESKKHREESKKFEKQFNELTGKLGDLDLEAAREAMQTVQGLDSKDLINSADANKKRDEITREFKQKIEDLQNEHASKMKDSDDKVSDFQNQVFQLKVSDRFKGSKALKNTIFESVPEVAIKYFGDKFKIEDGNVVGYNGEHRIVNPDPNKINEVAGFDDALSQMINNHPDSKSFKLAGSGAGGNSSPGGDNGDGKISVTREQIRSRGYANVLKDAGGDPNNVQILD